MLRRRSLPLLGLLAAPALIRSAQAQGGPPHGWLFGAWTGGIFPATDTEGPACFGSTTVIFLPDVVMRASSLEVAFRQRPIETVAPTAEGVEIRLIPVGNQGRGIPEIGFGCDGNPDLLRVTRRGADEIVFTGCVEFPSSLKRCRTR